MERASLWTRTLAAIGLRQRVALDPQVPAIASVAGTTYPQPPPYDVQATYSALARFPWVWSCAQAITTDLCGLPLRVMRKKGGKVEVVEDHPVLDLLARPVESGRMRGIALRQQITLDLAIGRNAFHLLDDPRRPRTVLRVHPESAKVLPDQAYLPVAYEIGRDIVQRFPWDRVIHIKGPSWMDGPQQVYGTSPIQVLELLLNVEHDAYQLARKQAKRGRPDAVLSPPPGEKWVAEQVKTMQTGANRWGADGGGLLINPWNAVLSTISQTAREMEFLGTIDRGTSATLAVMGVTPTRVGIQSANYATADKELEIHWTNLQGTAALLDDGWSILAERVGEPGDRVVHDFSRVPALQASKTSALNRVSLHIINGMDPEDAYREEGLESAADRIAWAQEHAVQEPAAPATDAATKTAQRHLRAARDHLRLVGPSGIPAEDVPELLASLEAASVG